MTKIDKTRQALEMALQENPDDLGAHLAYADCLMEAGDPRGEFVAVQLALEDGSKPADERSRLKQREKELLEKHEREWLGDLAPLFLGTFDEQRALFADELYSRHSDRLEYISQMMRFHHRWARGWLYEIEFSTITVEMMRKIAKAPVAQILNTLVCEGDYSAGLFRFQPGPDIPKDSQFQPCEILAHYPIVKNLRVFQYGEQVDPNQDQFDAGTQYKRFAPLVSKMVRVEELRFFGHIYLNDDMWLDMNKILSSSNLDNLRVYQHYHGTTYSLEPLGTNPSLSNLTHLLIYPHSFAQAFDPRYLGTSDWIGNSHGPALNRDNVRIIFESPYLNSLTHLQLRGCNGGDEMIDDLIESKKLGQLKSLDLRFGYVTDQGATRLARCPECKNLEKLDLSHNRLTDRGISALEQLQIPIQINDQQTEPFNPDYILYFGDTE